VVTHQLQVERRTGKVRQSETDVLPLCYATNPRMCTSVFIFSRVKPSKSGLLDLRGVLVDYGLPTVPRRPKVAIEH